MDSMGIESEFSPKPVAPIVETPTSISYLGVQLEKAANPVSPFVPKRKQYADFINDRFALDLQKQIAVSFLQGDPILIEGGTSIGKTTTVRKMCAELGYELHYANLKGSSDADEFIGKYIPNPERRGTGDPEYIFADGKVTQGLRQEDGRIKVIVLDEYNAASPNVLIRLHEVLDSLERGENVVLSEDASEAVAVDRAKTKVVALMNPPGKGYLGRETLDPAQLRRWVYVKSASDLPPETFSYATKSLFGLAPNVEQITDEAYLVSRDQALLQEQLEEIPGINEIVGRYEEFHRAARELVTERRIAPDQPQPFTFDDRVEPKRVHDFILRFYNGDINETVQEALRYYYVNKVESPEDKAKLEELIRHVEYREVQQASQRRGAQREDVESVISPVESSSGGVVTAKEAQRILDQDYLGPEMIKDVFGLELSPTEIPPIPFSQGELEKAKSLGQFLILRTPGRWSDKTLTMGNIAKLVQPKLDRTSKGKVFWDGIGWCSSEGFFKDDTPREKWALVGKKPIPGTTSKNYLEQTTVIADYLKDAVFDRRKMPKEYQDAIEEFEREQKGIEALMSRDWQEAAKRLAGLKLNQLTRQTPVEAIYDLTANLVHKDRRLMEDMYTWTNTQTSDGGLVYVGRFESSGANVRHWNPGNAAGNIGVCLSR